MKFISYFALTCALIFMSIAVHETGHYMTGRYLVKIPKHSIKIQLLKFPAYVSLRDSSNAWHTPNDKDGKYIAAYSSYDPSAKYAFLYIMSGFLFQTTLFALVANILSVVPVLLPFCKYMMLLSGAMITFYVLADILFLWITKTPYGDAGAALQIAPLKTLLALLFIAASHALLFIYR